MCLLLTGMLPWSITKRSEDKIKMSVYVFLFTYVCLHIFKPSHPIDVNKGDSCAQH